MDSNAIGAAVSGLCGVVVTGLGLLAAARARRAEAREHAAEARAAERERVAAEAAAERERLAAEDLERLRAIADRQDVVIAQRDAQIQREHTENERLRRRIRQLEGR